MSSKFRILQQNDGTTVFPITRAEGIYFKDNTTFDKLSFFPVGAIYISAQDTSPSQLFGGVWEKIEGVFLLGSSSSYTNGSIGGEETHTLSLEEIPSHSHEYSHLTIGSYGGGNAAGILVIDSIPRPHRLVLLDPHLHTIICLPIYRLICGNELSENHKHRISEITFNL